jgi:integrase
MGKVAKELGAKAVANLRTPGVHAVGTVPGLSLQVLADKAGNPTGARTWVLRVMVGGKRREMGLGGYPAVPLAAAHEAARHARAAIKRGADPIEEGKAARSALAAAQAAGITFSTAALRYIKAHEAGWRSAKHGKQWRSTLETYAFPVFGDMLVRDVDLPQVLAVLEPIWATKTETASRVRNRVELVLDWATARKYRSGDNPARWRGHLDKLLPKPRKVARKIPHAALPVADVGAFMQRLRACEGIGARALEFAILTAARSGEVRGATWAEIDMDAGIWAVPAVRMKASKEHRVPLSAAALNLLRSVPRMVGSPFVFAAERGGELSDMTLSEVMRRMAVPAVPHGFRSTFRDWASERTHYPHEMAEMALAHTIGNKVEAAYRRGDLFDKRRKMMDDWAAFLAKTEVKSATVVPMKRKRA